jgi:cell cycle related kinase
LELLPDFNKISFSEMEGISFEELCPDASPEAIFLLSKFLKYTNRISALEVKTMT